MITQMVMIGSVPVKMGASAAIPRMYREQFGRDLLIDIDKMLADKPSAEAVENLAYIMAKHAGSTDEGIDQWLAGFDGPLDVFNAYSDIFRLWGRNTDTLERSKKNTDPRPEE